jgi:UDP-glucuronate 4-epimerase
MNKKFLVTGGAGFIGSHLVQALTAMGHSVAIVDNLDDFYPPRLKALNLEACLRSKLARHYDASVRDSAALCEILARENPTVVIHLAASAGVRTSFASPLKYIDNNVSALQVLLNAMEPYPVEKFIFASSSSVYGNVDAIPYSEAGPVDPISPYAVTKLAGEQLCNIYAARFGFDLAKLRFFSVYGPRQRPDMAISKFTSLMLQDSPLPINGNLELARDYTYVDDIVDAIIACTEKQFSNEVINLGRSTPVPLSKVIELLSRALGRKVRLDIRPRVLGEPAVTCADIGVASTLLGYQPRVEIEEGINRFVAWYSEQPEEAVALAGKTRAS